MVLAQHIPPAAFPFLSPLRPLAFRVLSAYGVRDFFLTITPRPSEQFIYKRVPRIE